MLNWIWAAFFLIAFAVALWETAVGGKPDAMQAVVESGTGSYRGKLQDIIVCGKTGSVQNEPRPDHSVFIAYAPKENPKIAVSVYVEFSGQGARAAASIATLMIEKYLYGATKRPQIEEYVLRGKFLN
jgi:penicillin-binding protein 2